MTLYRIASDTASDDHMASYVDKGAISYGLQKPLY